MSLLTNIKYQYNSRILKDLFSSNEYSKFFQHLESHKDNIELYSQLLSNLCSTALLKMKTIFLNQKSYGLAHL